MKHLGSINMDACVLCGASGLEQLYYKTQCTIWRRIKFYFYKKAYLRGLVNW